MSSINKYFQRTLSYANLHDYEDRVTAGDINLHVSQFNYLYQDCFSDHLIAELCGDPDSLHPELGDGKRIIDADNIDAYFIRHHVVIPEITQTANSDKADKIEKKITYDMFVKMITDPPLRAVIPPNATSVGENRISYLLGDAGMGKTLAVLKALDIVRSQNNDYRGYKIIPIYIDLHDGAGDPEHPFNTIGPKSFRDLTQQIIGKATGLGIKKLATYAEPKTDDQVDLNIKNLALDLARNKYFLLIIFDNADRFYFEDAKYCFFDNYAQKRDHHIEVNLLKLINKFVLESALGKIGASILFVCRNYVYCHFRLLQDAASRSRTICEKHSAFQLFPITGEQAIDSRSNLMDHAIKVIKDKYLNQGNQYEEQLGTLLESMNSFSEGRDIRTLKTILYLSHQGLRSFLDFLTQVEIDYRKDYQLIDRLFKKPHNLLRLYLTNMRKRFSQKIGHFPNLFLVDGLIDKRLGFEEAHRPHRHTYWLKYFILRYVYLKQVHQVSLDEILNFFNKVCGYEDEIVRLVIGSLADPSTGRCLDIVPKQQTALHIQLLKVSDRGKILINGSTDCIRHPLCFDFDYLQLVTDDIWLALPEPWLHKVYVDASIGHTLKNKKIYTEHTITTLNKKIPAVLYFLRILKASLSWECSFRKEILKDKIGEKLIPNFGEIENTLFLSLEKILSNINDDVSHNLLKNNKKLWEDLSCDKSFDEHFINYERSNFLISQDM